MQCNHLGDGDPPGVDEALSALLTRPYLFDDFCSDKTPAIVIVVTRWKIAARFIQSEPHRSRKFWLEYPVNHNKSPLRQ
jgi:hypothetical protein